MAYNLRISLRAEIETIDATNYYDEISRELGNRFLSELGDTHQKITTNPQFYAYISSNPEDQFRDVKLKSFPYVIIFEVHDDSIIITAVLNTHRKPFATK